jgi:hypothetical protein
LHTRRRVIYVKKRGKKKKKNPAGRNYKHRKSGFRRTAALDLRLVINSALEKCDFMVFNIA